MNYESNIAVFCKESQERNAKWKGSSWSYTNESGIFEGGIESSDNRKLVFNYLKNLEQKMNDLYMLEIKIQRPSKGASRIIDAKFLMTVMLVIQYICYIL